MRADKYVANVLNISRNKASEIIKDKKVFLNKEPILKPSLEIEGGDIELLGDIYVSRAALKLKYFLEEIELDFKDKTAIDVGSSTGGFVQILLQNGVKSVTAVDVGTMQLHSSLKEDNRVEIFENTDIRELKVDKSFEILTCDVSFISLSNILEYLKPLFSEFAILLFKPQFEVGKNIKRDKKGVVKDEKAIKQVMARFELNAANLGLMLVECIVCKLKGKEGNVEYFYLFKK
ncbi:16S/23S rRNA (cytidine-2'-O)-methyltransferase [Campylobacter blaseri]|uniref:TlyA family rRNA (Cytidine-2'-O)-methyltransferase n=1 Tax=Campylobacter blaseri TaxID=2042961 RepID=A0A2P8R222_9BACT|nr:TlyA family RNA methyltransferase [Campylobacter blaseri]PSM52549.1 TlyA family rRNA (cytidine-2'-O)-methyltransferase [Campylobacter blaseri]PSM54197.1 TlyA family rRNA (cytidine-2'-O)-methyltransferase [Campylobacter blaseri]QKF85848.1 16S/23S rRNA (cytidine-2'-O)-methyltransferase [Campylobacter blaseri]